MQRGIFLCSQSSLTGNTMGILDPFSKLTGASGGADQPGSHPLLHSIFAMINNSNTGGIQGLVNTFHDKGLGGVISSWVGTGSNQPINPDQITHALGADRLQQIP